MHSNSWHALPRLVAPNDAHITALMQWFPDAASVALWSPANSFPFERERFIEDARLRELASFMLVDTGDAPLAFGQYYERLGCCHLGRLVVAPHRRREGLGEQLILHLLARGTQVLGTTRCSLFVLDYNERALRLYRRLGFTETPYPQPLPVPSCLYMTRDYFD
jgi:ribosomal protein S18 acetylase RimI-like enzyme